jgi:hypothetical protein
MAAAACGAEGARGKGGVREGLAREGGKDGGKNGMRADLRGRRADGGRRAVKEDASSFCLTSILFRSRENFQMYI